jgi:hypothetical protein
MKTALAALSALVFVAGFATVAAEAGQRFDDRGEIVLVQDFDGLGRYDRRDYRGEGRWHGRRDYDRREGDVISERRVAHRLMRQGFVSIEDIRLRRGRYIVEAVRPNGALVRLSVDAYDGEILSRERIGWVRDGGGRRGSWGGGDDFDLGGGRIGIYGR